MESSKRCKVCGEVKPLVDFYAAPGMRDGRRNDCKRCNLAAKHQRYAADPEPTKARVRKWQQENRERYLARQKRNKQTPEGRRRDRNGHLKRTHGLTLADYDAMLALQKGRCAICGRMSAKSFHIDHDHVTGEIRGLLCSACNHALGLFGESPQRLSRATNYVSRDLRRYARLDELIRARVKRELLRQ